MSQTPVNPTYSWPKEDRLNRKKDADILLRFIAGKLEQRAKAGLTKSYVLNLDSQWGSGKTFFLKNLKKQITANGQVAVYVDAWQDDHSNDPFLAVVSGIEDEMERVIQDHDSFSRVKDAVLPVTRSTLKIIGSSVKSGMFHFAKKQVGEEALEAVGELFNVDESNNVIEANKDAIFKATDSAIDAAGTAILSGFSASKLARASFRTNLEKLTQELEKLDSLRMPVFVLIDELDRCRPSYAVELLEEVKHLFNVENMVFILGTDTEQLAHAVCGVYGSGFDGRRYLSRFIDRTYRFRETDIRNFVEYCMHMHGLSDKGFSNPGELDMYSFLSEAFEYAKVSLRYIEQIVDYLATFAATWEHEDLKINLILLFDLAVKAHPESEKLEGHRYLALSKTYNFQAFKRGSMNQIIEVPIEEMVDGINSLSLDIRSIAEPKNEFQLWAFDMVREEVKAIRLLNSNRNSDVIKGIADEYPRMFNDMLGIHDALADG